VISVVPACQPIQSLPPHSGRPNGSVLDDVTVPVAPPAEMRESDRQRQKCVSAVHAPAAGRAAGEKDGGKGRRR